MKRLGLFLTLLGIVCTGAFASAETKTVSCHLKRWMEEHWMHGNNYELKIDDHGQILSPPESGAKQIARQSDAELARFESANGEGYFIVWNPTLAEHSQGVFRMELYLKKSPAHAAFGNFCLIDPPEVSDLQELKANWTCEGHDTLIKRMVEGHGITSAMAANDLNQNCRGGCDFAFCQADKSFRTFSGFKNAMDRNGVQRCYRSDSNGNLIGTDQNFIDNWFCQYLK